MSIAITDDHRALADSASDFLDARKTRTSARALLDGAEETRPDIWKEIADLGWLGLHVPEKFGGSGYGLLELVVVAEEFGAALAPGSFIPTVIASAVINAAAQTPLKKQFLPGLVDGTTTAGVGLGGDVKVKDGKASGDAGVVLGAALADILVLKSGKSVVIVDAKGDGVTITTPANIDPSRTSSKVTLNGAEATVLRAGQALVDYTRLIVAAEATGICRETTDMAAEYAKVRVQFGRVIAMYQGVKHHCANMAVATQLSTATVWDAAIQESEGDGADDFSLAAANAAALALPSADLCVNLCQQVHGGIGFTWEHDTHLYMRRATALQAIVDANEAKADVLELTRKGVKLTRKIDLGARGEEV
ncbi:MAG: hypothetical protein QOF21_645, partial [Actinomycetota bacterium]